jgi:Lrp/AsnC family leucine-responsive transcriptional regulator
LRLLRTDPRTRHLLNLDELDAILDRFLAFGQTTTSLLQSSPVPPRPLPLPGKAIE